MEQVQYATIAELESLCLTPEGAKRFGEPAKLSALQFASSVVNDYLRSTFVLPLKDYDMSLKQRVCAIAAKNLFDSFGSTPGPMTPDAVILARYNEAIKWLEDVSKRLIWPSFVGSSSKETPFVTSNAPVGFAQYNNGCNKPDNGVF